MKTVVNYFQLVFWTSLKVLCNVVGNTLVVFAELLDYTAAKALEVHKKSGK